MKPPSLLSRLFSKIKCLLGFHDYSYDPYEGIKKCWECGKTIKA